MLPEPACSTLSGSLGAATGSVGFTHGYSRRTPSGYWGILELLVEVTPKASPWGYSWTCCRGYAEGVSSSGKSPRRGIDSSLLSWVWLRAWAAGYEGPSSELVRKSPLSVIPAKAGMQKAHATPQPPHWIPAFAGMTRGVRLLKRTRMARRYLFTSSQASSGDCGVWFRQALGLPQGSLVRSSQVVSSAWSSFSKGGLAPMILRIW